MEALASVGGRNDIVSQLNNLGGVPHEIYSFGAHLMRTWTLALGKAACVWTRWVFNGK